MFGIFKYLWTVVFLGLCYAGYYFGAPWLASYNETGEIYGNNNFQEGELYREEYREGARRYLAENCKLGVYMRDIRQFACRSPERKHLWE